MPPEPSATVLALSAISMVPLDAAVAVIVPLPSFNIQYWIGQRPVSHATVIDDGETSLPFKMSGVGIRVRRTAAIRDAYDIAGIGRLLARRPVSRIRFTADAAAIFVSALIRPVRLLIGVVRLWFEDFDVAVTGFVQSLILIPDTGCAIVADLTRREEMSCFSCERSPIHARDGMFFKQSQ